MRLGTRIMLALKAFREAYVSSDLLDIDAFNDFAARRLRYAVAWAWYENTAYRDIHKWARKYRIDYALYRYIRNVYNPAYRLGEFYKDHLFGGRLDRDAGDQGAIPLGAEPEVREAISQVWDWSNWYSRKDVLTLWGTVLGDVMVEVVDDPVRERVYLNVLHPATFESLDLDNYGNTKGYVISKKIPHPETGRAVVYREIVSRDGELVVYSTYLNGELYAMPGNPEAQWDAPYGFVPLVAIKHNDVGVDWGWSEYHPMRSKVHEADDLASKMSDHIRKVVDPIWVMKGIAEHSSAKFTQQDPDDMTADRPAPEREELNAIWNAPKDSSIEAMIYPLTISDALQHIDNILAEIERDYPELRKDINTASGAASGRALRVARQTVSTKVQQRRANYDKGLIAAQQMALSIGGMRGYFPFDLDSYERGDLDHTILNRPVFEADPLDKLEIASQMWDAADKALKVGVSLGAFLKTQGYSDVEIEELTQMSTETAKNQED